MSFWEVEGEKIEGQKSIEVEGGSSNGLPIPAGTMVKIAIDDAKWETGERDGTYINLKHKVLAPACYKGRVIFQKLHVRCHEFKSAANNASLTEEKLKAKRAKSLRMLATIDANSGGKLLATPSAPDDAKLQQCLVGKTMSMVLEVYEFDMKDGQKIENPADYMRGNWVKAVSPKEEFKDMSKDEQDAAVAKTDEQWKRMLETGGPRAPREQGSRPAPQQRPATAGAGSFDEAFDDDIPF